MCELLFLVYLKLHAAVSDDPGGRVSERTPRTAATIRVAQNPTAAPYHSRILETLPRPAFHVGQTAGAAILCSVSCGKQNRKIEQQQTMRFRATYSLQRKNRPPQPAL